MGHVLILFDSATGNTARMADFVASGAREVHGIEVRLKKVEEASKDDVLWCDGIAVGSPTNMGVLSWKMKRFWDDVMSDLWSKVDGKIGCAFSSSGGWGGGGEITCMSILAVLMNFGFLVFGIPDYVADRFTLHYGAVVVGDPRSDESAAACRRLGKRLAQWVAVYADGRKDLHPLLTPWRKEGS